MKLPIASLHRLTLLDYPGHIACIVFLAGCNLRCHYCHNSELVLPEKITPPLAPPIRRGIPMEEFFDFLKKRQGKLEGVVVSGGEPTIHADLPEFCRKIQSLGYKIKLDTNGTNPEMLKKLLDENLLDYVAMDIKASPERFEEFCGVSDVETKNFSSLRKSRDLLFSSGIDYELRTTLVKQFHDEEEFKKLCAFVQGAKKWVLQNFRASGGCLNPAWEKYSGFAEKELFSFLNVAKHFVCKTELR